MSLTSRKLRPLNRKIQHLRDTRLVIIATEGELTEKQYFSLFERKSSRLQVKVLETTDGASAPKHVLQRLQQFKKDFNLLSGDALWLVVDKDRWPNEQLSDVARRSQQMKFGLAVSNPCFELWLYLHQSSPPAKMSKMSSRDLGKALSKLLGSYDKANIIPERFEPHVDKAIENAKALDVRPGERWPNQLGTRVYRVIEAIRERMG